MQKRMSALVGALVLLGSSAASQAIPITATYDVHFNASEPGLVVHHSDIAPNAFTTDLWQYGDPITFDLFKVWTDEGTVDFNDRVLQTALVDFDFSLPGLFGGTVTGHTVGVPALSPVGEQHGELTWNDALSLHYEGPGASNFTIALSDQSFNFGDFLSLNSGEANGAVIQATITRLAVPAPAVLGLFSLGLAGVCAAGLRRRRSA